MKKEVYFLCPECHKLIENMYFHQTVTEIYEATVKDNVENKTSPAEMIEMDDIETVSSLGDFETECTNCGKRFNGFCPEDFLVKVSPKGAITPLGRYWVKHKEELGQIY